MASFSFPSELNYSMLSSMYPSKKSEYRRQPINTRTFNTPGEEIQLILSKMDNSFWNPDTLAINFTVQYTCPATSSSYILGNGYSHFSRQVWTANSNGQKIETIQNPAELVNAVMNMTVEGFTKQSLATSMGFGEGLGYTNLGRNIVNGGAAEAVITQSFSIPVIGIMNTTKLIPAFVSDLQLDLTLNSLSRFIYEATDAVEPTAFAINSIEIVCESLTLEAASMAELLAMYPGILKLKSSSYLYGASQLAAGAVGVQDITYSHSLISLTEFIWWSSIANAGDKTFGGINPNLGANGYNLIINSTPYPSQPVKCDRGAECFYQLQKAWGSVYSTSHSGSITRSNFLKANSVPNPNTTEYSAYTQAGTAANAVVNSNSNKWYACIDLELINNFKDALYSGISTKDGTHTFRLNIDRALGAACALHYYSKFDVVLEFDYINRAVNVIQ